MPRHCIAAGCSASTKEGYSLHKFPLDDSACAKCTQTIKPFRGVYHLSFTLFKGCPFTWNARLTSPWVGLANLVGIAPGLSQCLAGIPMESR